MNTFDADCLKRFNKYIFTHLPTADPEVSFWKKFSEQNSFLTMPNSFAFYIKLTVFSRTKDEFMKKLGSSFPLTEVFQMTIVVQSRPVITFSTTDADRI